jgi:hypothetical protein
MKDKWKVALHPVPEPEKYDTGLRYTDILFGFVIRELFLRLQNWANVDLAVRLHLVVGLTLVLGSWIGFRRSLNRPLYQLKFFNLPLIRFLLDQLMLIFYFRIAVLTPAPEAGTVPILSPQPTSSLAQDTNRLVFYVFILYALWDLFGILMAATKYDNGKPRYPEVNPKDWTMTNKDQAINWWGIGVTAVCLLFLGILCLLSNRLNPCQLFLATTVLLLVYRWSKEVRTSWKLPHLT